MSRCPIDSEFNERAIIMSALVFDSTGAQCLRGSDCPLPALMVRFLVSSTVRNVLAIKTQEEQVSRIDIPLNFIYIDPDLK